MALILFYSHLVELKLVNKANFNPFLVMFYSHLVELKHYCSHSEKVKLKLKEFQFFHFLL